ncbi:hypothetical protein MW887_006746 [Aspergillus wentii]|nr:hypothetical protein MW887_006746 [Aspergillus wentii]
METEPSLKLFKQFITKSPGRNVEKRLLERERESTEEASLPFGSHVGFAENRLSISPRSRITNHDLHWDAHLAQKPEGRNWVCLKLLDLEGSSAEQDKDLDVVVESAIRAYGCVTASKQ